MRSLLDENLHESVAKALRELGGLTDDEYLHILEVADPGTRDGEIPALCGQHGIGALFTANVKDFGARKIYFQALLAEGVSVVVLRPRRVRFTPTQQVGLLATNLDRVRSLLSNADSPCLISVTPSGARIKILDELVAEIEAGKRELP